MMRSKRGNHRGVRGELGSGISTAMVRRLIISIALLGIIPIASMALSEALAKAGQEAKGAEAPMPEDLVSLAMVGFSLVSGLVLWKGYVTWSRPRQALTVLCSSIPVVPVAFAHVLLPASRTRPLVELALALLTIPTWIWLTGFAWWGCDFGEADVASRRKGRTMTGVARSVVASLGIVPFAVGASGLVGLSFAAFASMDDEALWLSTGFVFALLVAMLWMGVWHKEIVWTGRVRFMTVVTFFICFGPPIAATTLVFGAGGDAYYQLLMLAIGYGAWIIATVYLWPLRTSSEELGPPTCPRCGYNLTGLTRTRCPECGTEPTLDELCLAMRGSKQEGTMAERGRTAMARRRSP